MGPESRLNHSLWSSGSVGHWAVWSSIRRKGGGWSRHVHLQSVVPVGGSFFKKIEKKTGGKNWRYTITATTTKAGRGRCFVGFTINRIHHTLLYPFSRPGFGHFREFMCFRFCFAFFQNTCLLYPNSLLSFLPALLFASRLYTHTRFPTVP